MTSKKIILSGIQPTQGLMLGNYLGALKNWVKLQSEYDCYFMAVDLHAITVRQDPKLLRENTYLALASYIACGIDPDQATVFVQSHVPQHAQLGWMLTCYATMGELNRMTQYKEKSEKHGQGVGLYTYPVLMAADILLYNADLVPVGADQKQHLELTRDLAIRLNNLYAGKSEGDELFRVPEPFIPPVGARIMSLQDPTAKMSKSDANENASIYLLDDSATIVKKIKRAVTDSGTEITYDESKPGVQNLLHIQSAITGKPVTEIVAAYAGKMYGHLKVDTAEIVAQELKPIREKILALLNDKPYLESVFAKGATRAREKADATLRRVSDRLGFIPAR